MFISIEGIEGSGKSTQAALLSDWLNTQNIGNILTKEPGTVLSKECQQIRRLLLSPENELNDMAELFLYLADRAQHVDKCIKPALWDGKWVVSDRFSHSTLAYQGYARGNRFKGQSDWFRQSLNIAAHHVSPDIVFIMDMPAEIGLDRARSSNVEFKGGDRIEREDISFHKTLREGFLKIAEDYKHHCVIIDATQSIGDIHKEIVSIIKGHKEYGR